MDLVLRSTFQTESTEELALDARLRCVTTEVSPDCHADIGTDHALLPLYLLNHQICSRVIATERSPRAFRVARQALWGRGAEVLLGEGLAPLEGFEVRSLSICGMGGSNICEILRAHPEFVPDTLVLQANRDAHKVRRWAFASGFHLIREQLAEGFQLFEILTFHRRSGEDPAYLGLDRELGFHFGPHLLRSKDTRLEKELQRRRALQHDHPKNRELQRIRQALLLFDPADLS